MNQFNYIIYLLINTNNNRTYVGITNNPNRRLRQHNGELKGGAKYTTNNKGNGIWKYYCQINNLSKTIALSLEKKIKILSKRCCGTPIEKRLIAINNIVINYNLLNKNKIEQLLII